ncbi:MAG: T9SS type A sorting domain-containing protein [Bacteroidota bacterium]
MKNVLYLFLLVISEYTSAQKWEWARFTDQPLTNLAENCLATDKNANFYLKTNLVNSSGHTEVASIIKYNIQGNKLWTISIEGEIQISDITTFSEYIYISGSFRDTVVIKNNTLISKGENDVFLACLTSSGTLIWVKRMGGKREDMGGGICTDSTGSIYLTGGYSDTADFDNQELFCECVSKMFIAKCDSAGNINFIKSGKCMPSNYSDNYSSSYGLKVSIDPSGNIFCYGSYNYFMLDTFQVSGGGGPYTAYFLSKFNSSGITLWANQIPDYTILEINDINLDISGNVLITGYSHWKSSGSSITIKYNPSGEILWERQAKGFCYGGQIISDAITSSGTSSYIIGQMRSGYNCQPGIGEAYLLLVKYDSTGYELIYDTIQTRSIHSCDIIKDVNNDFIICGAFNGSLVLGNDSLYAQPGKHEMFIAKFSNSINTSDNEFNYSKEFILFPNPSSSQFTLQLNVQIKELKVSVYDVLGNYIYNQQIKNISNHQIDLSNNAKGIYFVEIDTGIEKISKKIVLD